jgi:hypothetical protein
MFKILKGQGFRVDFDNGNVVEVRFGPQSESEHKNTSAQAFNNVGSSQNAEIRIYYESGDLDVRLFATPQDFAEIINEVS